MSSLLARVLVAASCAFLVSCSTGRHAAIPSSGRVAINGPTVIGFFPGVTDKEISGDPAFVAALDQLEQAIKKTSACFGPKGVSAQMVRANVITIIDGENVATIQPGLTPSSIGAFLVAPGRAGQAVQGGHGTVLSKDVPAAASKYFGLPNCD